MVELKMDEFFSGRGLDGEREVKRMEERWKEIKKIILINSEDFIKKGMPQTEEEWKTWYDWKTILNEMNQFAEKTDHYLATTDGDVWEKHAENFQALLIALFVNTPFFNILRKHFPNEEFLTAWNTFFASFPYSQVSKVDLHRTFHLGNVDLHGLKLLWFSSEFINLAEANLEGYNFQFADARGGNFEGANLRVAKFDQALLKRAKFSGADIGGATFREADLTEASGLPDGLEPRRS